MGKWGLFSALRYLEADRGGRRVRADGRSVQRPLRTWSETVRAEARRRRQARRQPKGPRVLGWAFMGIAILAAVEAEYPIPRPAHAAISVRAASCLLAIDPAFPAGLHEGVPTRFVWATTAPPPFTLVVLDAGYRELARIEAIAEYSVAPDHDLRERLGTGRTYHWYVQGEGPEGTVRSPLEAVEIR